MNTEHRIQQFRRMAEADPGNDLAHFSLDKALLEAGRFKEALAPLQRALELNPEYSRAFQLLATAERHLDMPQAALETLRTGIAVAHRRGDLQPRDEMIEMLIKPALSLLLW